MNKKLIMLAVCAALIVPTASQATPARRGPYVSGFIGVSGATESDATTTNFTIVTPHSFHDRVKYDPSINIGGTGGFDFGMVRVEGELSYKQGEISSISSQDLGTGNTFQFVDTDGRIGAFAMMFNTFIDFHNYSLITPYIGGGIGVAFLHLDDTFGTNLNPIPGTNPREILYFHDDASVFAYQVGAGFDIAINPRLSLDLAYRYFGTETAHFNSTPIVTSLKFESHNGSVGIRVKF
jgi:opacity protein-like surface antigen